MEAPTTADAVETFFRRDVIGGVIPGILVITEFWLFGVVLSGGDPKAAFSGTLAILQGANFATGAVLLVGLAAGGWVLGWTARKLGFVLMDLSVVKWAARRVKSLPATTRDTLRQLKTEDPISYRAMTTRHDWWPFDPECVDDDRMTIFHHAKQWLIRNDPQSAALDKEATINALAGVAVAGLGTLLLVHWVPPLLVATAVAFAILLIVLGARERRYEEMDVLRAMMYSVTFEDRPDTTTHRIPWGQFETIFKPIIRAELDWEAAAGSSVWLEVLDSLPGDWHTVWYLVGRGTEWGRLGAHHESNAVPLTVSEAAREVASESGPLKDFDKVREIAAAFASHGSADLLLAAWRTRTGRTIILDGNHRVVAAALAGVPVRTVAMVIRAPADCTVLPDLVHHLPDQSPCR
ncbi:MAG: hypothetical protein EOL89_00160 [Actinobacteria bacterium]|nr:hypothetical protein [Actinomycetota bacterium]